MLIIKYKTNDTLSIKMSLFSRSVGDLCGTHIVV